MNFFAIFFWIFSYASGRNETKRWFLFSLSKPFPTNFGLECRRNCFFYYFLKNFAIFLEFSMTHLVGTEQNDNFYFLSLSLFQPIFAWIDAIMVFFNFLNFFAIFFEFSVTHRVGTERNDNFYFLSSSTFSTLFWLQKKP